ncbi:MAG: flagellar hook-associated protein FlgK, partial [Planctomycetes bacterium]|nr:flagellar hook-associated protein FlgK [Planctomycetota bacterium]
MNGIISNFGSLSRNIIDRQEVTSLLKDALNTNREGVSGVSIDEELVSIILLQQNFAASAKVISTVAD